MTDERIREFERRARAGRDEALELRAWIESARRGALPAEAAALVERVMRGELDRERLALAAYAGHAPALALLEGETAEFAAFIGDDLHAVHVVFEDAGLDYPDLREWLPALRRWGVKPFLAAQLGVARALVEQVRAAELDRPPEEDEWVLREWQRAEAERTTQLTTATQALDAAERFLRTRAKLDGAAASEALRIRATYWDYRWERIAEALSLALRSAIEEEILEDDRRRPSSRALLDACERERVPADAVARAAKRAVVAFALR